MRDARSRPVMAGVEDAKKRVAASAWREGRGSVSLRQRPRLVRHDRGVVRP